MRRQLCINLVAKISRNFFNPNAISIPSHSSQPIFSSLVRTNNYTTQTPIPSPHSLHKIFANRIVGKHFFSNTNTFFECQSKSSPVKIKITEYEYSCRKSWFQKRFTTGKVVLSLIVTNVAVFLLWKVADPQFMRNNFMISVENFTSGRVHTLITSAFSHYSLDHLTNNMLGLLVFGILIGGQLGPQYLLNLYFSGALAGSIFFLIDHAFIAPSLERGQKMSVDHSKVHGLGASGAVNAIMLLHIFLNPGDTLINEFMPVPAILLVGVYSRNQHSQRCHATAGAHKWTLMRHGSKGQPPCQVLEL